MTFIPRHQEKHCFVACSEDKVNSGLCDCINRMRNEALHQPLEVSFDVTTYSLLDKNAKYCHWSEGLNMIIEKNGVTIKLNSEEIQQIVKSLPRTLGGCY